jgi:nucleoside-diphosphate-sugar epimerase
LVLELIPSSASKITYRDPVPDDPSRRRPDIARARTELGWQPRVPLREGVSRTIEYFRQVTAAGGTS